MKNRNGVIAYLLIAFGMAWAIWEIVIRLGISVRSPLFQIAGFPAAFAPAIAAFVVRKWITREGFADAGLRLNLRKWPYYLVPRPLDYVTKLVSGLLACELPLDGNPVAIHTTIPGPSLLAQASDVSDSAFA